MLLHRSLIADLAGAELQGVQVRTCIFVHLLFYCLLCILYFIFAPSLLTSLPLWQLSNTDIHISYLPLAHMFERIVQAACFAGGASIGFYRGVCVFITFPV